MPRKLPSPHEHLHLRLYTADIELLRAVYGRGQVNAVIRALVEVVCEKHRAKLNGSDPASTPEGTPAVEG